MDDDEVVREVAGHDRVARPCREHRRERGAGGDLFRKARDEGSPFDIVILDLTVKRGMGGEETIRRLREMDPDIKAVVSSGYSDAAVVADYRAHGFSACLNKPYRLSGLRDCLLSLVKHVVAEGETMAPLKTSVALRQEFCIETKPEPCGIVIFGASGDLAHRKLIPSLFRLFTRDLLPRDYYLLGCLSYGESPETDEGFRAAVRASLAAAAPAKPEARDAFLSRCFYLPGDYRDPAFYARCGSGPPCSTRKQGRAATGSSTSRCRRRCRSPW